MSLCRDSSLLFCGLSHDWRSWVSALVFVASRNHDKVGDKKGEDKFECLRPRINKEIVGWVQRVEGEKVMVGKLVDAVDGESG